MKTFGRLSFRLAPFSLFIVFLPLSPLLLVSPSVVHAQWEPDRRLTFNDSASYISQSSVNGWPIATFGDSLHIVWYDYRDRSGELYYKRSLDGGTTWDPDIRLTIDSLGTWMPSLAVEGLNVHVVWQNMYEGKRHIYYKRSTDGGANWEQDFRLSIDTLFSYSNVVSVSGSNVHVFWMTIVNPDINYYTIYYRRSTDKGQTWGPVVNPVISPLGSHSPSASALNSFVHLIWTDERVPMGGIFYKRSTDNGETWSQDALFQQGGMYGTPSFASIAVSDSSVHAVWVSPSRYTGTVVYKRSENKGLNWGPTQNLSETPFGYTSYLPSIVASGSNVHVVWQDNRDHNWEIYYKHSSDKGSSWSACTRLTNDSAISNAPSIATSDLKVHVIWQDFRNRNYEIYYKRNPTGNAAIEEKDVNMSFIRQPLSVSPNPFTSFATIPGHSSDPFTLYDISGRKVGTYRGDRIGEGLSAGVYFLCPEGKEANPLRVVKVR